MWQVEKHQEHDHLGRGEEGPSRPNRRPLDTPFEKAWSMRDWKLTRDDLPVDPVVSKETNLETFLETDGVVVETEGQEKPDFQSEPEPMFAVDELPDINEICRKWAPSHSQ